MKTEGLKQLKDREYSKSYNTEGRKVVKAVLVADDQDRSIFYFRKIIMSFVRANEFLCSTSFYKLFVDDTLISLSFSAENCSCSVTSIT